ncbi:protein bark beetle [Cimex lectularius]|uniref:SRCR domain-containing protein n=1 Tax=Cimex lectularius TaxID=79782 RepID=A0A8I6S977_CIMLE|nr:protein bark beetle [Cimex lectularius]
MGGWRNFGIFLFCLIAFDSAEQTTPDPSMYNWYSSSEPTRSGFIELQGGLMTNRKLKIDRGEYILKEDLIVDHTSELALLPGTTINFAPTVGITVRGIMKAEGTPTDRIIFQSLESAENITRATKYRLVDGASILSGRLQAFHNGKWRSVCSNSRRWSVRDVEVICREMGWLGGSWVGWMDRESGRKPRLLILPNCTGTETTLQECEKNLRQMGGPTCDYHPDIAIQCFPQHDPGLVRHNWRGLRFENAKYDRYLTQDNTFYVPYSASTLSYVDIRSGGSGRDYNASSSIEVIGVPPQISNITIFNSAYNAINITHPVGPITISNTTIANNGGYGIFVNSSDGGLNIENSQISENDGDGVRYFGHEYRISNRKNVYDLCTLPTTTTQTFPLIVALQQNVYSANQKDCNKHFFTKSGHVLTINFLPIQTNENGSSQVTVYDGYSSSENTLASFSLYNATKPQSVTTTKNNVYISFSAKAFTDTYALIRITSGFDKWVDVNITDSTISDNNGRGVAVENLRSRLYLYRTSISHNNHVAGVHVKNGAGHVNVTESRISFNIGDGINVTYTGGCTNISKSSLSSNIGSGVAVWFNDTMETPEYPAFNFNTIIQYSEIFKNVDKGILVGNFCGDAIVNITGNWFNLSLDTAIEVKSCWKENVESLKLFIGHNIFIQNRKLGIKIRPAVNLKSIIEFNRFIENVYGGILIKNDPLETFDTLPSDILIRNNEFYKNQGVYVVNLGLSPYSDQHSIHFTWNFVKDNKILEPFDSDVEAKALIPRSRVAAPLVISSENVIVFRNIIQNPDSQYEIGAHLQDQSKMLNCTYNWLGSSEEKIIFSRIFDRKDRYNLAKILYLPYLLHRSNPGASAVIYFPTFVPLFITSNSGPVGTVGGEVDGLENLRAGEYIVERDINVRPGGRLTLEPGVTLKFPPGVGMMVAGKLEARGKGPNDILLMLKEDPQIEESTTLLDNLDGETYIPPAPTKPEPNVRLIGGKTSFEGTLQVKINSQWGTVCNYGWTQRAASLVCNQLGLILNPNDWLLYRSDIPHPGTNDPILLTNVECGDDDFDITECKLQRTTDFENACTHLQDVLMRCYPPHWAGVRLGPLAERSHLQYITIQQAGILDYSTNEFKPALQIDFSRHTMENVRLIDNAHDGLGIVYSDIYSTGGSNTVKNCEFSNNKGSGVGFKQLGLRISGSKIENNKISGIRHNPTMTNLEQREFAGWFKPLTDVTSQFSPYDPIMIPQASHTIEIEEGNTKYIITQKVTQDSIESTYYIKCKPGFVIGLNLLNPIHNRSTEEIWIHDSPELTSQSENWNVKRDINIFPTTSASYGVVLQYRSGIDAFGMTVIAVSTIRAPKQVLVNKIIKGPVPTLTVHNTRIKGNQRGIWASFYNRYLTELGEHYLRKSNETIQVIGCDISHNEREAVFIDAPYWSITHSNLSEITLVFNNSLITDNGRGFYQYSRDLRNSTNLFHWNLNDNSIERNSYGGFEILLPYVWDYNENFTHSVSLRNNTWRNNRQFGIIVGGHFSDVNITNSEFVENICKIGLISIQGMEKRMKISNNIIEKNVGVFMLQFKADSQSEIMGELKAKFVFNSVKKNRAPTPETPSGVILFDGIQRVRVKRNLISENNMDYSLVAGVRTSRLESSLDVSENWWGTKDSLMIKQHIFDFDDWNDHALAIYHPFLVEDAFEGSLSVGWEQQHPVDLEVLGGRLTSSLTLFPRPKPYLVISDITVLPGINLRINPGVTLEFSPRVGILVLGTFSAQGLGGKEIVMKPTRSRKKNQSLPYMEQTVRLCTATNCTGNEGFVERWNSTTQQWVPVCDERFSERNAQVTCRQLMRDSLDIYVGHDRRYELHHSDTSRIWSWHEPLQCTGDESRLEDCEIRLNGQVYGHIHRCDWDSQFVFVHCGKPIVENNQWGGIRFANADFEQSQFENRIHDVVTHSTLMKQESIMEFVNITGAGLLHSQKSPAILAVSKSPTINNVNITDCADHGISLIAPTDNVKLLFNGITNNLGVGVNIASITGEGRESGESSFTPLKEILLPYKVFSLVDMCDPSKEIIVQERLILYYIYDNRPVNCVKIFYSAYQIKPFGFRLLQFNLYNSTDHLDLFDGGLYNHSVKHITSFSSYSPIGSEKKFVKTLSPRMSVHLVASAASQKYGFIAEVVTLPISAIGFNRDVQHNISFSVISQNKGGAIHYSSVGEVNPRITIEKNQLRDNCIKMYGNFTSCKSGIYMDLQNTQNLHFRNNLVQNNQGGVFIRSDSRGSATSLKGWIHNNLFTRNKNRPALSVEGRQSSPYQQVTIYNNFWSRNKARYENTIRLQQVVSNFTYNYLYENIGANILEVSGFERVRLPIYQSTTHNGFYWNLAVDRDRRSTITAGTAGQHYVDNIFFNPDNDYEIVTVNRSLIDVWQTPIDAKHNYWGYNETLAVMGRIRDRSDQANLLEVDFRPFLMSNSTILDVKCPPGWFLVGDTCYIYIGAPMNFFEAREFCRANNATMPYVMGNHLELYKFLKKSQETYQFYDRVWVQHIDRIHQCTVFSFQKIEIDYCNRLSPFVCEMDPKVVINPLSWRADVLVIALIGFVCLALLLIGLLIAFWFTKSRHRHLERLERRNSIRQSLHSVRSFGSSHAFSDMYNRRNGVATSTQSSPTLNKNSEYKKMSGSVDSIEKSQFNSSNEDTQSYDIYEAHNPTTTEAINPGFDLSFRNQGFRDNSTFASQENSTWQSTDDYLNNSSTLPLNTSLAMTDSTVDIINKSNYQREPDYQVFYERPKSSAILETNLDDSLPPAPPTRTQSENLLETSFDNHYTPQDMRSFQPLSKSQPLETAM